jgi:hypothetical protein
MKHLIVIAFCAVTTTGFTPIARKGRSFTRIFQTPSIPSWAELSQQKSEALKSLTETHDGTWVCEGGAVSSDGAGGSFFRSVPFQSSVSTRLGLSNDNGGDALKLVETLSWGEEGNTIFGRSCALGSSVDVDSVDGSYSLHATISDEDTSVSMSSCALPQSISGIDPAKVTSIIENCIMGNGDKRVRCFFIYGKNVNGVSSEDENDVQLLEQRLLRVVVSHETKKVDGEEKVDDVIQQVLSKGKEDGLEKLSSALSNEPEDNLEKYPVTMMSLSLGPWLGDIIIRDKSYNSILPKRKDESVSSKGFSKQTKATRQYKSGFGEWVLGVQKVAMTFKYDFDTNIRQVFTFGKSMGIHTDELWPKHSSGIIYDDRMSRRIKTEDRSMYIDYDNGAYCGFVFDSVYAKASRFLTTQRQGSSLPMLTEFALFQKSKAASTEDSENGKDLYCSRITRLYNDDGTLAQGATSFFTLQPMAPIEYGSSSDDFTVEP